MGATQKKPEYTASAKRPKLVRHSLKRVRKTDALSKKNKIEKEIFPKKWKNPGGWASKKLKYLVAYNRDMLGNNTDPDYGFHYIQIGDVDFIDGIKISGKIRFADSPPPARRIVRPNDVIVSTVRTYLRAIGVVPDIKDAVCSTGFCVLRGNADEMDQKFLSYAVSSEKFIFQVNQNSYGVAYPSINPLDFIGIEIEVPSLGEQKIISKYLDFNTKKIDSLLQKTQTKLELLKEQRISLVTHYVTKGLNQKVIMKDSDCEFIGNIPQHWTVKKLKYLITYSRDTLGSNTDPDYGFHYIQIGDVNFTDGITINGKIRFGDSPTSARRIVRPNDVIVSTVRTYLRAIGVVPDIKDAVCSTGFCVLRGNAEEMDQKFLSYAVQSECFISEVSRNSSGVAYPTISPSELVEIKIAVPPKLEQLKIAKKLSSEINVLDQLIKLESKKINLYREYRHSLISSTVTRNLEK